MQYVAQMSEMATRNLIAALAMSVIVKTSGSGIERQASVPEDRNVNVERESHSTVEGCLVAPQKCSGLTVAMRVKVRSWSDFRYKYVFWTGAYPPYLYPGVSIYSDARDRPSVRASVLLPTGDFYQTSIRRDLIGTNKWTHIATTWSRYNGIKIFINGFEVLEPTTGPFVVNVGTEKVRARPQESQRLGHGEVRFYKDEVKVWYRELKPCEVAMVVSPEVADGCKRNEMTWKGIVTGVVGVATASVMLCFVYFIPYYVSTTLAKLKQFL